MWVACAQLSALLAALTAIRTVVVLIMAWSIVFATGKHTVTS